LTLLARYLEKVAVVADKGKGFFKMPEPINYLAQMPQVNLGERLLRGLQIGAGFAQLQEQQAAKQQADQRLQSYRTELESAFNQGTPKAFSRLMTMFPEHQAAIKPTFDQLSKELQDGEIAAALPVASALLSGNAKVAKDLIQARIDATPEGQDTRMLQSISDAIDRDPVTAKNYTLLTLSRIMSPEKFAETFSKLAETSRAEVSAPEEMRKKRAEAITAEAEAKFKEKQLIADLEKKAADLGLTKAQTGSAIAQTKKLGVETAKAVLELKASEATGGIDPEKKFTQEEKIRKEWQGRTKVYGELQGTYNNIQASSAAGTGAGDIALITGFMKMLDPGSVVRETEFATARDTAGLFAQLENRLQKAQNGQLLQPEQRKQYVSLAKQYLEAAQKKAEQEKKDLNAVVKNYKLNPENVFGVSQQAAPIPAPTPSAAQPSQDRINQLLNKYGSR
jgi:hypothetical protein